MKETKELKLSSLTEEVLAQLNNLSNKKFILTFDNTKGIEKRLLNRLNDNCLIRIIGGLDYKKKPKYYEETYYIRTLYTPKQLYKIIECFELLEHEINPFWSNLEKAMYYYRYFTENITWIASDEKSTTYEHLKGIVSKRATTNGLTSLMKEAMDRIDIPCYYMSYYENSWNVLKFEKDYYPIDLKKECILSQEKNKPCRFQFFGRDPGFFQRKDHKIDKYEPYFLSSILSEKQLINGLSKILEPSVENIKLTKYEKDDKTVFWLNKGCQCDALFDRYLYCEEDQILFVLHCDHQFDMLSYLKKHNFQDLINNYYYIGDDHQKREDIKHTYQQKNFFFDYGHSITIIMNSNEKKEQIYSYYHLEVITIEEEKFVRISKVYSEDYLLSVSKNKENIYKESLLNEEHLKDRIEHHKGYLGFYNFDTEKIEYNINHENWFMNKIKN